MRSWFAIVSIFSMTVWSVGIPAQNLKDLLKEAVDDYIEEKSEELGIDSETDGQGDADSLANPVQKVTLVFTGITLDSPDVFQALHTNSPASNPDSPGKPVASPPLTYRPAVLALPTASLAVSDAKAEQDCYQYVQGNIAWDAAGKSKNWNPANVRRLCKGTTAKFSPGNCFSYIIGNPAAWGKKPSHSIDWSGAIDLCEGTSNASKSTACFKGAIASGSSVIQAIRQCEV